MGRASCIGIVLVACVLGHDRANFCAAQVDEAMIGRWITQLGDPQFGRRQSAMQSLIEAGLPASRAVSEAALGDDREVAARAIQVLTVWYESPDDPSHKAAKKALLEIAASGKTPSAGRAQAMLALPEKVLAWVIEMGGEFTIDEMSADRPVIQLNLDRTRGIDPLFSADTLRDEDLGPLKILRDVRSLTLQNRTTFTDSGLAHVARLTKLKSLNLAGTSITGEGLAHLQKLGDLETLNLAGSRITGDALLHLAPLPQLKSLNLSHCTQLKDPELRHLLGCRQIRELQLNGASTSGCDDTQWVFHLRYDAQMRQDHLQEYRGGITDIGLKHIGHLQGLTSLTLRTTRITDAELSALANLHDLEHLDVCRTAITDDGLQYLANLSHLKTLRLDFTPITDAGLQRLKALENLEELRLRGTAVSEAGLRELNLAKMRTIDLWGTYVSDASIDLLRDCPQLKSLDIANTRVTYGGTLRLARECENFSLPAALLAERNGDVGQER